MPTNNNNQTTNNQSSTPSPQTQNAQSSLKDLLKLSRKISPLTSEILKIISILSILFVGLGFLDTVFYVNKYNIPLSFSFLKANNLEILIILPILLLLLLFIVPYFLSNVLYLSLEEEEKSFNNDKNKKIDKVLISLYIFVMGILFTFFFYALYKIGKGNSILLDVSIIYIITIILTSFSILFKWECKFIHNKKINNILNVLLVSLLIFLIIAYFAWNKNSNYLLIAIILTSFSILFKCECKFIHDKKNNILYIINVVILLFLIFLIIANFAWNKNSNYLLIISDIYYFFIILPFNFYIYKYFNEDLAKNKSFYFISFAISITIIFIFLGWIILNKPSEPFKLLRIGGNIPINLLVSQKYFNEITRHNTSNKAINKLKWYKFKLLIKTSNSYYVKLLNNNIKIVIIPVKYIYSESYNTKTKTKKNNKINKINKQINNITTWYLVLGPNKCDFDIGCNRHYYGHFDYGYFYN
jgi:hypothetical protein